MGGGREKGRGEWREVGIGRVGKTCVPGKVKFA